MKIIKHNTVVIIILTSEENIKCPSCPTEIDMEECVIDTNGELLFCSAWCMNVYYNTGVNKT